MDPQPTTELATAFLAWLQAHPGWTYFAIFSFIAVESLLVIGLLIPGSAFMIALGVLISLGALPFWPVFGWACLGALAGDGFNYWLGRRYRVFISSARFFQQHPEWLPRAEAIFLQYGAASLIIARIVGPLRPFIPTVAGMANMPAWKFFSVTAFATLLWAPLYLFGGIFLGASLQILAGVAMRLAVLLGGVIVVGWATGWGILRGYHLFVPWFRRTLAWSLNYAHRRPVLRVLTRGLRNPNHPHVSLLVEVLIMFALSGGAFFVLFTWQFSSHGPLNLDSQVFYFLRALRTPIADHGMVALLSLSSAETHALLLASAIVWLSARGHGLSALYAVATICFAGFTAWHLYHLLPLMPPERALSEGHDIQLTVAAALHGFLAILIARGLARPRRAWPYMVVGIWLLLIALARLYLGKMWLSDAAVALALGLFWAGFFALVHLRHPAPRNPGRRQLILILAVVLALGGGWQVVVQHQDRLARYRQAPARYQLGVLAWAQNEWRHQNQWRIDNGGSQTEPMNVQWNGKLAAIHACLEQHGWRAPEAVGWINPWRWLSPATPLENLPWLPLLHDGRHESLRLSQEGWLIRLWAGDSATPAGPIWEGSVGRMGKGDYWGLLTLPRVTGEYDAGGGFLRQGLDCANAYRRQAQVESKVWSGEIWLLRAPREPDPHPADWPPRLKPRPSTRAGPE